MKALLERFIKDERGLETVEYAVMTALIVAALITAVGYIASAVTNQFNATADVIDPPA